MAKEEEDCYFMIDDGYLTDGFIHEHPWPVGTAYPHVYEGYTTGDNPTFKEGFPLPRPLPEILPTLFPLPKPSEMQGGR